MKEANKVYLDNILSFLKSKNINAKPVEKCEESYLHNFDNYLICSTENKKGFLMHVNASPTRLTFQTQDLLQHYYNDWIDFCLKENGVEYAYRLESYLLKLKDNKLKKSCEEIKKYSLYWSFGIDKSTEPNEINKANRLDNNLAQINKFIKDNEKTK